MKIKNINVHFTEAEIDKKIRELGARISEDYAGESVCLICILKGASFFTCELEKWNLCLFQVMAPVRNPAEL